MRTCITSVHATPTPFILAHHQQRSDSADWTVYVFLSVALWPSVNNTQNISWSGVRHITSAWWRSSSQMFYTFLDNKPRHFSRISSSLPQIMKNTLKSFRELLHTNHDPHPVFRKLRKDPRVLLLTADISIFLPNFFTLREVLGVRPSFQCQEHGARVFWGFYRNQSKWLPLVFCFKHTWPLVYFASRRLGKHTFEFVYIPKVEQHERCLVIYFKLQWRELCCD